MEFIIRSTGKYTEVTVKHENVVIELGLLNDTERRELLRQLLSTCYELSD